MESIYRVLDPMQFGRVSRVCLYQGRMHHPLHTDSQAPKLYDIELKREKRLKVTAVGRGNMLSVQNIPYRVWDRWGARIGNTLRRHR